MNEVKKTERARMSHRESSQQKTKELSYTVNIEKVRHGEEEGPKQLIILVDDGSC